MKKTTKFLFLFLFISSISFSLFSCDDNTPTIDNTPSIVIKNEDLITLEIGDTHQLEVEISLDGNMSLFQAHEIADNIRLEVLKNHEEVKHILVHVNPLDHKEENDF